MGLFDRIQNGWNAFIGRDPTRKNIGKYDYGPSYSYQPDRFRHYRRAERSIVTTIYNKIAVDCAAITVEHVQLDQNERFDRVLRTGLNQCLTLSANIDQTGRSFMQNVYDMLLTELSQLFLWTRPAIHI